MSLDRRRLLRLSAAGLLGALAGCAESDDANQATDGTTPTETAPGTATATESTETPTETDTPTETPTETATATLPESTTVAVLNNYFSPIRESVAVGGTVTWSNQATGAYTSHTITSATFHDSATAWEFDVDISGGEEVSHTFQEPGIYEYYCRVHGESSMCGVVLVGDAELDQQLPCE